MTFLQAWSNGEASMCLWGALSCRPTRPMVTVDREVHIAASRAGRNQRIVSQFDDFDESWRMSHVAWNPLLWF